MANREKPLLIGLSACLGGSPVRYDAGHKRQELAMRLLTPHGELRPFCPEVEAGLGVPRPPVHLIASSDRGLRAVGVEDPNLDVTTALQLAAARYVKTQSGDLSGFVLKSRSPSCGLDSTPIHREGQATLGTGLFAQALRAAAPWLAVVEEEQLQDEFQCYRFLSACCAVNHYRDGDHRHDRLLGWLRRELGVEGDLELRDELLAAEPEHEKAALLERLSQYWKARLVD